jgi:HSP20 family protein
MRTGRSGSFYPAVDLIASEEDVTLVMDVPGLKDEDLQIELCDGMLRIVGERRHPSASERTGRTHHLERGYGRFERVLRVPKDVDPSSLTASIEDGVLTVRIPMPEARKPHRIEICSGEAKRAIEAEWSTAGGHQEPEKSKEGNGDRELAAPERQITNQPTS